MKEEDIVICRCEDITLSELRCALQEGITDFEELKRVLRFTMGPCQGRTCRDLVLREIAQVRGIPVEEIEVPVYRPPTTPVKLGELRDAYERRRGDGEHG